MNDAAPSEFEYLEYLSAVLSAHTQPAIRES